MMPRIANKGLVVPFDLSFDLSLISNPNPTLTPTSYHPLLISKLG